MSDLRLRENQIHSGMIVRLCLDGKEEPEKDGKRELILQALLNAGHPFNPYLYPIEDGFERYRTSIVADPLVGFKSNVRFQPINIYTPEEVPVKEICVIFVNGEFLLFDNGKCANDRAYVWKNQQGNFRVSSMCSDNRLINGKRSDFSLPEGALLVSIEEVQKIRKKKKIT